MKLEDYISSDNSEIWEKAYFEIVKDGLVGIDEWIILWFWNNIRIPPSRDYSIFSPNVAIDKNLMNVHIRLACFHQNCSRYVRICCWSNEEFYPYFDITQEPDKLNMRFESQGNPIIDNINYRKWEEYLLFKMVAEILLEKGGIDAIVEGIRRKY
jgi:hypothetical protein